MERPLSTGFLQFFSIVFSRRPWVPAASTTNQSDIRGLVRQNRTRADRETLRRESGVLRTRVRRPLAACRIVCPTDDSYRAGTARSPLCPSQRAIRSADFFRGGGALPNSPPVPPKALNAILLLCPPRMPSLSALAQGEGLCACCGNCRSIAHTKPASSRTTAMIATGADLPRSIRCRYRRDNRFAARSARSTAQAG